MFLGEGRKTWAFCADIVPRLFLGLEVWSLGVWWSRETFIVERDK
jgi:hypothetical protein